MNSLLVRFRLIDETRSPSGGNPHRLVRKLMRTDMHKTTHTHTRPHSDDRNIHTHMAPHSAEPAANNDDDDGGGGAIHSPGCSGQHRLTSNHLSMQLHCGEQKERTIISKFLMINKLFVIVHETSKLLYDCRTILTACGRRRGRVIVRSHRRNSNRPGR